MQIILWIILMTFVNGLIGLAGVFSFFISKQSLSKITTILVSLAIGGLLGGAFFHFIPEAYEKLTIIPLIFMILLGILIFFLIEKILHWHHCHDSNCKEHPYTRLILLGDSIHNFIDGLLIAGSFIISIPLGITTSLLIMAHELPQEIGNFGVLIHGGFTKSKALLYNFFAQLTAILGGVIGYFFLSAKDYSVYLLPFAAGGFLYIAIGDLFPEVFKEKGIKKIINIIAIILGLLILFSSKLFIE